MYLHCRTCVLSNEAGALELELTAGGLDVRCRTHGRVVLLTPNRLQRFMLEQPACCLCAAGKPHKEHQ